MSKYGQVAELAAAHAQAGSEPVQAWEQAAATIFPDQPSSREKVCPRCAFLGLASEGLLRGVEPGEYTTSRDNKRYAIDAVRVLRSSPELASDPEAMWQRVMAGVHKKHNEQMTVVTALWASGYIA